MKTSSVMSRANLDIRKAISRTRTQTAASAAENRFLLTSSAGLARLSSATTSDPEVAGQLLEVIENQRGVLGQQADDMKKLQSDISTMGKMLVEERSKSAQYSQMCSLAEKELETIKQRVQESPLPASAPALLLVPETPPAVKKLSQENFLLKTDLDNLQHQLTLLSRENEDLHRLLEKVKRGQHLEQLSAAATHAAELETRVEEYEDMIAELQKQVVWVNGENSRLGLVLVDRESRLRDLEAKLSIATTESIQTKEAIERLNVEAANRRYELDKRSREIKELKEQVGYLQQISDKSPFQLKLHTSNEEDLKRKITNFKSETLVIADKYQTLLRDRGALEERVRFFQLNYDKVLNEMEILSKEHSDEKAKLSSDLEALRQEMKGQFMNVQELETELKKKGKGYEQLGALLKLKQDSIQQLTTESVQLKAEWEAMREELNKAQPTVQAAQKAVARMEEELTQSEIMTADYEQMRQESEKIKHAAFALEKEIVSLKKDLETSQARTAALETDLSQEKNINKNWEAGLLDMKKEVMDAKALKATCHELQDALSQTEEDARSLKAQYTKKVSELDEACGTISELRHSIDHQHQVNTTLKEQVDEVNAQLLLKLPDRLEIEAKLALLHSKEEEVKTAIGRTVNATKAIEGDLCCIVCLQVVEDAVVCIPCGHFYCKKCREGYHPHCQLCGQGKKVKATMKIPALDEIAGKIRYRKKIVSRLIDKKAAPPGPESGNSG